MIEIREDLLISPSPYQKKWCQKFNNKPSFFQCKTFALWKKGGKFEPICQTSLTSKYSKAPRYYKLKIHCYMLGFFKWPEMTWKLFM